MSIVILSLLIIALFLDGWALSMGTRFEDCRKSERAMRVAVAVECVALLLAVAQQVLSVS